MSPEDIEKDALLVSVKKILTEYNLDWDFDTKEVIENEESS